MEESNLRKLEKATGFKIFHESSQRIFAPPSGPIRHWPHGTEIHVSSLPPGTREDLIYAEFSKYGKIRQTRLPLNQHGKPKLYAFILYETREQAWNAVDQCVGKELKYLQGQFVLQVSISRDNRRIFFGRIPTLVTKEEIRQVIEPITPGLKNIFLYKQLTNYDKNRGFCFLEYNSRKEASEAKFILKSTCNILGIKKLIVNWAYPEPLIHPLIMDKITTIFIRGLKLKTNEDEVLWAVCSALQVWPNIGMQIKRSRDYAFITFTNRNQALEAVTLLHGMIIDGAQVEVQMARPSAEISNSSFTTADQISASPNFQPPKITTIFIRGLKLKTSQDEVLWAVCSALQVRPDIGMQIKRSRDYAFITFTNRNQALEAVTLLHGMIIDGAQVEVQMARPSAEISNSSFTTADQISASPNFQPPKAGAQVEVQMARPSAEISNSSFTTADQISASPNFQPPKAGAQVEVQMARPSAEISNSSFTTADQISASPNFQPPKITTIFIRGLKLKTSEVEVLWAVCSALQVWPDTGMQIKRSRDYAFITFTNRNQALEAVTLLHGMIIDGAQVEVQMARPSAEISNSSFTTADQISASPNFQPPKAETLYTDGNGNKYKLYELFPASS